MSKKKKKKQSRINPETWANVKLGLSTLISNNACIRAAREWHGVSNVLPIVLALGSVVISLIPTFVSQMNSRQSDYVFANPTANYEAGLASFHHALVYDESAKATRNLQLVVSADGMHFEMSDADIQTLCGEGNKWYTVTRNVGETDKPVFEVYFNKDNNLTDNEFVTRIDAYKNPYTNTSRDAEGKITEYQSSYLYFGKNVIRLRKRNEAKAFSAVNGSYKALAGRNLTSIVSELEKEHIDFRSIAYEEAMRTAYVEIINASTEAAKIAAIWQYTGIFAGINAGIILLFGLLMFLMTRGKKNPFRIFTFWETQKMSYWAAFTPSVLAMILGFILANYAAVFFMFAFGMRMMWMSMRSLRPQQ